MLAYCLPPKCTGGSAFVDPFTPVRVTFDSHILIVAVWEVGGNV